MGRSCRSVRAGPRGRGHARRGEAAWLASAHAVLDRCFALEDPTRLEPAERELFVEASLDLRLLLRGFVDRLDVAPDGAIRSCGLQDRSGGGQALRFYAGLATRGVVPASSALKHATAGPAGDWRPEASTGSATA